MGSGRSLDDYGLSTYRRDKWTCQYCGFKAHDAITFRFLSVDHVRRRCDGGGDEESNLVTACRACNDYYNRRAFASFEEKHAAIQTRLAENAALFERLMKPDLRVTDG